MKVPVPKFDFRRLAGDCAGGAIAALIALPYGLAMAALMGLPPILGVFTSILTAPITAFLGRNPVLIGGTSSVTVPFVALAVQHQGIGGAAKVTLVAAVVMMALSVLRAGRYISKVPFSVVSGFSCGIGAMMVVSQLNTIFGLRLPGSGSASGLVQLQQTLANFGGMRWAPFVLAAVVLVVAFVVSRLTPKLPAPLIGVAAAFVAARVFGFAEKEVGRMAMQLPPFAGFLWSPSDVYTVLPSGVALAFVSAVNILITSRVVEHFRGRHQPLKKTDADIELGAYGIANVCAGVFGAPMSVGIPARSLANVRCGGTSRVSNLMHAVFLVLFLTIGSGAVARIPIPALAGVTAYVGLCLLEWGVWRRLAKMRRTDAAAFLCTAGCALLFNAVAAVIAGCLIAAIPAIAGRIRSSTTSLRPVAASD